MSFWFPQFSPNGRHVATGNGPWRLDGVEMPGRGYAPVWRDANRVLLSDGESVIMEYSVTLGTFVTLVSPAYVNNIWAGEGQYCWFQAKDGRMCFWNGPNDVIPAAIEPTVSGPHRAYLLDPDAEQQRLIVDGREVMRAPMTLVRSNQEALCWNVFTPNDRLAKRQVYGMRWTDASPIRLQPSWETCFHAYPISSPYGLYLLTYDNHRLLLVQWGTSVGWVLATSEVFYPHGAWNVDDLQFHVQWTNGQGVPASATVNPATTVSRDVFHDDQEPPVPPPPEIAFTLDPVVTSAPCVVTARLTKYASIKTHRYLVGVAGAQTLIIDYPIDGVTHDYSISKGGSYDFAVRAQPLEGETITTPRQTLEIAETPVADFFKEGVQTGFGEPIVLPHDDPYQGLSERRWLMARVGANLDPTRTSSILAEVDAREMEPLVIINDRTVYALPTRRRLKVEFFNEPDIGDAPANEPRQTPAQYIAKFTRVWPYMQTQGYDVFTGGISNIGPDPLRWLRDVLSGLPPEVGVCYHRYPQNNYDVASVPRKGYRDRDEEFAALFAVTGSRRVICSEFGWSRRPTWQGWWKFGKWRVLSEQEILDRTRMEFSYLREHSEIIAGVVYQLNGEFGLRLDPDSPWRPVANVLM